MPPEKKEIISTCKHVIYQNYNIKYQKHVIFQIYSKYMWLGICIVIKLQHSLSPL